MKLAEYEQTGKTFVIAEIGQAHDGSLGILYSMVDAAASCGVDAVKFQVHIANAESSPLEPFRIPFSKVDKTRYDYWKRMELSEDQWRELKTHCDNIGVEFLATPFSNAAVDLLESIGVTRYKVGSGDLFNPLLLSKLISTNKEIILSTGLATYDEITAAVDQIRGSDSAVAVLQCTTKYPTKSHDIGLADIADLKVRFNCPAGLSDHSGEIYAGLGAVALGANIIEAHVTFDKSMFGPDAKASLTFKQLHELVQGIRFLEEARKKGPSKSVDSEKSELRKIFGKALSINKDMSAGATVTMEDLEGKKPANAGVSLDSLEYIIGKKLTRDVSAWEFLQQGDVE